MNIDEAVMQLLLQDPQAGGVAGVFGAGAAMRIYPNRLPEKPTYPAAAFRVLEATRVHSYAGPSGYAAPTYEVMVWGPRKDLARAGAEAIRKALDGFPRDGGSGVVTGPDGSTLNVNGILLVGGGGDVYDDELKVHGVELLFLVMHHEA